MKHIMNFYLNTISLLAFLKNNIITTTIIHYAQHVLQLNNERKLKSEFGRSGSYFL